MDLNSFVHMELLSTCPERVFAVARKMYEIEQGYDDFAGLHPEDQQYYLNTVRATMEALEEDLLAFNGAE